MSVDKSSGIVNFGNVNNIGATITVMCMVSMSTRLMLQVDHCLAYAEQT